MAVIEIHARPGNILHQHQVSNVQLHEIEYFDENFSGEGDENSSVDEAIFLARATQARLAAAEFTQE